MTETELRMTDHELLALLSMTPTESAVQMLELLRLEPQRENQLLNNAGLTTLMVRGLATLQGEKIVPVDRCAVVGSVLSQGQEWLEISLTTPTSSHVLFAVGSNVGAILLSIGPYGVHEIQPIESGPALLELGLHLSSAYLTDAAEGLPATAVIRRLRIDAEPVVAQLTAVESGDWVLRSGSESEFSEQSFPAAEAMAQLKVLLSA